MNSQQKLAVMNICVMDVGSLTTTILAGCPS